MTGERVDVALEAMEELDQNLFIQALVMAAVVFQKM